MEEKISHPAITSYSQAFAARLADEFFSKHETISGPEILQLAPSRQVNLFVIRELMKAWKLESEKLRSPYFDYTAAPVHKALAELQNLLSNHIAIRREHYVPLLERAVARTLLVVLVPYDFFSELLDASGKAFLRVEDLRSDVRYLKINSKPLEKLLEQLDQQKVEVIPGKEAFAKLDQILEAVNFSPEELDGHLEQLNTVVPVKVSQFYITVPDPRKAKPKAETPTTPAQPKPVNPAPAVKASAEPVRKTLADDFQKIQKLKDSLSINQKFMFTKMLFKGDFEAFSGAIDFIDSCATFSEATQFVESTYPDWDRESEEFAEFLDMLEKRFS